MRLSRGLRGCENAPEHAREPRSTTLRHLLFSPPFADPTQPYLSLRTLKGALRARGLDAQVVDLVAKKDQRDCWGKVTGETWEEQIEDYSGVASSLRPHLDELLSAAGGIVSLDAEHEGNPLVDHVRSVLLPILTTEPEFRPADQQLSSTDIEEQVRDDWSAFVRAPWSSEITGTLALAKYLLEGRERPRFWNEPFEHVYGFRRGMFYLARDLQSGTGADIIEGCDPRRNVCGSSR